MPVYSHECRECSLEWLEEYNLKEYDRLHAHEKATGEGLACPDCESTNTYRQINWVPTHFKGGGWSPQGYYKYEAYDSLKAEGRTVEIYEDKADMDRVIEGEKRERIIRGMKRENEIAKRTIGPDAAFTEKRAEKVLEKRMNRDPGGKRKSK